MAQIGNDDSSSALVFEPGKRALPRLIRCTKCRRNLVLEGDE